MKELDDQFVAMKIINNLEPGIFVTRPMLSVTRLLRQSYIRTCLVASLHKERT